MTVYCDGKTTKRVCMYVCGTLYIKSDKFTAVLDLIIDCNYNKYNIIIHPSYSKIYLLLKRTFPSNFHQFYLNTSYRTSFNF